MNKYLVEKYIEFAYESMKNNKPNKSSSIRGQIATFGAAISSGSLLSAIAFFSNPPSKKSDKSTQNKESGQSQAGKHNDAGSDKAKEDAKEVRIYLLDRIYDIILEDEKQKTNKENAESTKRINSKSPLFDYVLREINQKRESEVTERILSAAVAVKLALNLFE